jgi:signal transduction histidine kinase
MRLRIILLVVAASSLVLVCILVPLALVLPRQTADRAWPLLLGLGLLVLVLSVALADRLARSLVRPLADVARAADRLAAGDLSARAELAGPPEVRRAGAGLNKLARRIGDLLAHERETIADVSHRLRTPMTALRIDAESLGDHTERPQVLADLDALERTVDQVIREARRPAPDSRGACDAAAVVAQRTAFWLPLAETNGGTPPSAYPERAARR